jgi:predicted MPP superfamily phosphohydrolase
MSSAARPGRLADSRSLTRRSFLAGAGAAGLCVTLDSNRHGRHAFEIVHRTFPIANLPEAFQNFRIVQMSDIHLKEFTETWFLEEMVRQVNALKPELVLLTGDFVTRAPLPITSAWQAAGVCAEILTGLTTPQRYAILGNHDVAVGATKVAAPLVAHGTPVLANSYVPLERGADRIWLCGLDDVENGAPDPDLAIPADPRAPVIFLCHEPDYVDHILHHPRFRSIDVMLSGHSHGGQIRLPLVGPLILPPLGKKYPEGLYRFGHMQMYVNRGIGTVGLPLRLNCPAELTCITLVRA